MHDLIVEHPANSCAYKRKMPLIRFESKEPSKSELCLIVERSEAPVYLLIALLA